MKSRGVQWTLDTVQWTLDNVQRTLPTATIFSGWTVNQSNVDLYDSDDLILKRVTRELESQKISGKLLFALAGSDLDRSVKSQRKDISRLYSVFLDPISLERQS